MSDPNARRPRAPLLDALGQLCVTAAKATPSPQQVDLLVRGFDRLYKLWQAAKSGLL